MNPAESANSTPQVAHAVLEDVGPAPNDIAQFENKASSSEGAKSGEGEQAAPSPSPDGEKSKTQSDVDKLILEVHSRARARTQQLDRREQGLTQREGALKTAEAERAQWSGWKTQARTDPGGALEAIAKHLGLDPVDAAETLVKRGAGVGESAEERVARLEKREREREDERVKGEQAEKDKAERAAVAEKMAQHISDLKGLAQKGSFPLIQDDLDTYAQEAFDLMAIAHANGQRITHINALHLVEKELRERADKFASKLGYQKPSAKTENAQPTTPSGNGTAPAAPPRQTTTASAAPLEHRGIPSDDDILADFKRGLGLS